MGPPLVQRYHADHTLSEPELTVVDEVVANWRSRVMDISWFMRCLNEHTSRKANAENGCKGRFWESRFASQTLLNETAVLACVAYADLNPICVGVADRPETSSYTSLQERLGIVSDGEIPESTVPGSTPTAMAELLPFSGVITAASPANKLPFNFADYLKLAGCWKTTCVAAAALKSGWSASPIKMLIYRT